MTLALTQQQIMDTTSDQDVVLSVQGVSKKFCRDFKTSLFYGLQDLTQEVLGLRGDKNDQLRKREFWALQDVSFELRRGEALGLVGKNGSGKSTLLRVIAGLIKPDVGMVRVKGRVAPLIALGAGFNPILTGRENIYANMSILGLSKDEIDQRFDQVVAFAEIPDSIDAPVRSYSSGMQARLGFACAVHTEPDILLIDEALAVGDIKFRAKCHRKLGELRNEGKAFVLVSHQAPAILNVCKVAVYMSQGKLLASGETTEIMRLYERDLFGETFEITTGQVNLPPKDIHKSLGLDITHLSFRDQNDSVLPHLTSGESVSIWIGFKAKQALEDLNFFVAIRAVAGEGDLVLHLSSFYDDSAFRVFPGEHTAKIRLSHLGLNPGKYSMAIYARAGSLHTLDAYESFRFSVKSKQKVNRGLFYQSRSWEIEKNRNPEIFKND